MHTRLAFPSSSFFLSCFWDLSGVRRRKSNASVGWPTWIFSQTPPTSTVICKKKPVLQWGQAVHFPLCTVWLAPCKQRLSLECCRSFLWRNIKAPAAGVLWLWDWVKEWGCDRLPSWPRCSEPSACQDFSDIRREADTALHSGGMSPCESSTAWRLWRIRIKWSSGDLNTWTEDTLCFLLF